MSRTRYGGSIDATAAAARIAASSTNGTIRCLDPQSRTGDPPAGQCKAVSVLREIVDLPDLGRTERGILGDRIVPLERNGTTGGIECAKDRLPRADVLEDGRVLLVQRDPPRVGRRPERSEPGQGQRDRR